MAGFESTFKDIDSSFTSTATSSSGSSESGRLTSRGSLVDSFRGCGLSGIRVDKDDIRRRILLPGYLRVAMAEAMRVKDASVGPQRSSCDDEDAPQAPIVIFVNSRSGGRHGPILKGRLQDLLGEEQVFDLSVVNPSDFVQYGLACLERMASQGDTCAKESREKMRIMVAGGDGTVGWLLGSIGELFKERREPVPPIGIIPLGTGNDLSRSFGWGGSFPFAWKSAVKRSLCKAITGQIVRLDSWQVVVSMQSGEEVELPHSLEPIADCPFYELEDIEGKLPAMLSCFGGVFYNYFSIGMDAQVAYGFHQLRDEMPHLAHGPTANKLIYSGYSCSQGWFFTPCLHDPSLRGLNNIVRLQIKKINCSKWEQIRVPSNVRAIVALNLHNYASGRNPWGNLKPEYLEKRGFVEAHFDDGLLEIFGLKQGWHASFVMVELISAKHLAQAASIRLEIRGGQWAHAYMQMDGEPWKQPINKGFPTFVEIKRVPFQSLMINGE